jgi:hypothetical protein
MGLVLNEADLDQTVFLIPPLPFMTYTWADVIKLRKVAALFLLIASTAFIGVALVGSYMAFFGFILDPNHHIRYGNFGLIPGILLLIVGIKMVFSWLKLLIYLLGFGKITK